MDDLVERLYEQADRRHGSIGSLRSLEWKAGDRIEAQEAEIHSLRERVEQAELDFADLKARAKDIAASAEAREAALMKNVQWAQDCMMDYVVEIAKLREALADELAWHEGEAKALGKQPPRPELEWPKHQHRERIEAITAALETDNG